MVQLFMSSSGTSDLSMQKTIMQNIIILTYQRITVSEIFSLENGYVSRKVSIEQERSRKDILSDYLILAWSGIMWLRKMLRIHI